MTTATAKMTEEGRVNSRRDMRTAAYKEKT